MSDSDDIRSEYACPTVPGQHNSEYERGSAHRILYITAIGCMVLTILISLGLTMQHLRRYRVAKEQRHIVKVVFTPVAFTIIAVAAMSNYHVAPYIAPLGELYAAFALVALFLLYIQFAAPGADFGEDMFVALVKAVEKGRKRDKATWPMTTWVAVFQLPVAELICLVVEIATEATGRFCPSSMRPRFGNFWVTLIRTVAVITCFVSIIHFYGRMRSLMKVRRAVTKLFTLKGVVFIGLIQNLVFTTLLTQEVLVPDDRLTYGDWTFGVPGALLCAEMVIFSLVNWYAFSSSEYSSKVRRQEQPRNFFAAIIDAMNPLDLFLGIIRIVGLCGAARRAPRPPGPRQQRYQNLPSDWSGAPQEVSALRGQQEAAEPSYDHHEMYTPAPAYSADDEAHLIPGRRSPDVESPPPQR